jgi:hypothetical protein
VLAFPPPFRFIILSMIQIFTGPGGWPFAADGHLLHSQSTGEWAA